MTKRPWFPQVVAGLVLGLIACGWALAQPERFDSVLLRVWELLTNQPSLWMFTMATVVLWLVRQGIHRVLTLWPTYRKYLVIHHKALLQDLLENPIWTFTLLFMAGPVEEIAFRGGLQQVLGLGLTSLLFGLLHMVPIGNDPRGWVHVVPTTLAGLYYGVSVRITGSLWPAIIVHAAGNVMTGIQILQRSRGERLEA